MNTIDKYSEHFPSMRFEMALDEAKTTDDEKGLWSAWSSPGLFLSEEARIWQ